MSDLTIPACSEGAQLNRLDDNGELEKAKKLFPTAVCTADVNGDGTEDYFVDMGKAREVHTATERQNDDAGTVKARIRAKHKMVTDYVVAIAKAKRERDELKKRLVKMGGEDWYEKIWNDPFYSLMLETGASAVNFGIVTEVFGDLYTLSQVYGSREALILEEMNQLKANQGLCGTLPAGTPKKLDRMSDAAKWGLGLGLFFGAIAVHEATKSEEGSVQEKEPAQTIKKSDVDISKVNRMTAEELSAAEAQLDQELATLGEQYEPIAMEQAALEEEIRKRGGKVEGKSFWSNSAVRNIGHIGIGFGIGTKVLAKKYQKWRFHKWVDKQYQRKVKDEAARRMGDLVSTGVLAKCDPVKVPAQEPVTQGVTETDGEAQMSMLDEGIVTCELPATTIDGELVDVGSYPELAGGTWYTYNDGYNTTLVDETTYQELTRPLQLDVSEAELQAFTEADYQRYLQYPGPQVANLALTRLPSELQFLYQPADSPFAYEDPLMEIQPQIPDLVASAYAGDTVPAAVIKMEVRQLSAIYGSPYSVWKLDSFRWALGRYIQSLEAGVRPDVSQIVKLAGEKGIVHRYFEIKEIQRGREASLNSSWNWDRSPTQGAQTVTFEESAVGLQESEAQIAYNKAHPEIAEARRREIEEKAYDAIDARIAAFNEANAPFAWKMTLMIVTGQAVYNAPTLAVPAAGPVTAESVSAWSGYRFAYGGI